MVTISLSIKYDLLPEDRRTGGKPMNEYEMEKDLVENCIIPAVKHYLPDLEKTLNTIRPKRRQKKCGK
ncbi:MAG: hypothetical protein LBQ89_01935 [Treponema sp.]|jgi:hypothetical protein|nr:hypothetical protein [Treponema sp.]